MVTPMSILLASLRPVSDTPAAAIYDQKIENRKKSCLCCAFNSGGIRRSHFTKLTQAPEKCIIKINCKFNKKVWDWVKVTFVLKK